MKYKKKYNSFTAWVSYCEGNRKLIEQLNLPEWVFLKESNFRDFATTGQMNKEDQTTFDFNLIEDILFWELFEFVNTYPDFDFDSILFTKFEASRLSR